MTEKCCSVYINNLNERVRPMQLKALLLRECEPYGPVEAVYVGRGLRKRGQAFIAFKHHEDAISACSGLNGREFCSKPMQVALARSNSTVNMNVEELNARRAARIAAVGDTPATQDNAQSGCKLNEPVVETKVAKDLGDPHNVLLLQKIPDEVSLENLKEKAAEYAGFKEARMFSVKHVGFLEFETVDNAMAAIEALSDRNIGSITYAKK